jgi:hypothetical protein
MDAEKADEKVKTTMHSWFAAQPKTFFNEKIRRSFGKWTKCIQKLSDYVKK